MAPLPDPLDQLLTAEQPVAVLDQDPQQGEYQRLDRNDGAVGAQFAGLGIQATGFEAVDFRYRLPHLQSLSQTSPCVLQAPSGRRSDSGRRSQGDRSRVLHKRSPAMPLVTIDFIKDVFTPQQKEA